MTIPELMYGARRYDAHGYLGDDFTHMHAQATTWVSMGARFAELAIRNPAVSIIWSLLFILFGLLVTGLPSLLIWRALNISWAIGALVVIGTLMTGFTRKMIKFAARKHRVDPRGRFQLAVPTM